MSIAQQLVAGEGETHRDDSAALTAFRCDSTNLPWIIFRAAFRAAHIEEIPPRARAVLSALARTVDAAKPFAAIFARRELLTGRALQSMRTFYRSLDDLESAGLIDRRAQSRYVEAGLFGRAYIHLTERAAELLGLVEPMQVPSPEPNVPTFENPSANLADGGIYKDLSPSVFQKRQPGQVPADLQRLRSLGFFDFLIFKLMREARDHGQRLSDVVEATWDHLKLAKAPINYLRSLLRGTVDFAHQLRQRTDAKAEQQARLKRASEANEIARQSAGQTFVDASGRRTYVIDTQGENMVVYHRDEGIGRQAAGWKEAFAAARKRRQIRVATAADLQSFAHTRPGEPEQGRGRSPVTAQIREHIAGLRNLLGVRQLVRSA
ncbi:Replication protein O [Caballeronia novacaledonica]|uniref:Replication protein O n=1 Tax=Caballeronia novacaledonica TaxID=1544861 RepID=A0AA37IIP1_9BURK|nr:Replication protein O [Caballeronia novacaledonica]GJH30377.1 Replication protein O [Caballeronia novacaledonica]